MNGTKVENSYTIYRKKKTGFSFFFLSFNVLTMLSNLVLGYYLLLYNRIDIRFQTQQLH